MSILQRILAAVRTRPANPQGASRLQIIGPNSVGLFVDEEVALSVSTVWACVDLIGGALASSDWNVYGGSRGTNDQRLLPDDSLQYVLNVRPNPEMTAKRAKQALMTAALLWGNGFAEIVRDGAGRIVELWPIEPKRAELRRDMATGALFLQVTNDWQGGIVELPMRDVLHIGGPGLSGLMGDKPLGRAVRAIALALAQERYAETYFGNNTQIGGWLEAPTTLGDAAFERLKSQLEAGHKGVKKAFKFAIFEGGAKWHPADANAEDAQLVESRHLQIEEVCRYFHVPPHKVGHLLRATNNNIEHQGLEFSREALRPWKLEIEQECTHKLIAARGPRKFIELDIDWTAEGDFKSRMEGYSIGRAMGVYSVNDVLRKLGENTIGTDGDVRTMNGAAVRLEDVGKNMLPAPAPSPAPEPEEDEDEPLQEGVAQAWLASTYARIARRYANRVREAGPDKARADVTLYAREQLPELNLGREAAALDLAMRVATGDLTPAEGAAAFFEGSK